MIELLMAFSGHWRVALSSALSMIGRGCTGALPLALTAIASRHANLAAGGAVAAMVALAYLGAELADFQAQRDIARSVDDEHVGRALAYRVSVYWLIFPAVAFAASAVERLPIVLAFVSTGIWTVVLNTYSGSALRRGDFQSLAIGPAVGFGVTMICAVILPRTIPGLLGYALSLHVGRAAELAVMIARTGFLRLARFSWRKEWRRTKHLLLSSMTLTIVGRSLTPGAYLLVSPAAAGVFAISTQLLAAFALIPLSIATTAFHDARGSATASEAMNRMRGSLRLAVAASTAILAPAVVGSIWAGQRFLGYDQPWMFWTIGLSLASGILEPWVVFSTAALHLAFRDRDLVIANAISAAILAFLTPFCAWAFGPIGLGIGLSVTRLLVVPLIWIPKTRA